jgi:hypothetical protein
MKRLTRTPGLIIFNILILLSPCINAQTYVFSKNREAQLHLQDFKQLAMGDIVGPVGIKTEKSLDLADAITSKLFNSGVFEVIDRNNLSQLLASQKRGDLAVIDEKTVSYLSKELNSALLVSGRLQSDKIEQKLVTSRNGTCPGNVSYQWVATGEVAVQIKVLNVKTGKTVFTGPITVPINQRSTETCQETKKFDEAEMSRKAFDRLADEVVKLFIPWNEQINIVFKGPAVILFKNPFKNLNQVVSFFEIGDFKKGLEMLKAYAEDASLKKNLKPMAHYNYALGFFCNSDYENAKKELKAAMALDPYDTDCTTWYSYIEKEEQLAKSSKKAF